MRRTTRYTTTNAATMANVAKKIVIELHLLAFDLPALIAAAHQGFDGAAQAVRHPNLATSL